MEFTPADIDQNEKISDLTTKLQELELEIAERRPLSEVIKYSMLFISGIGLFFTFFGITEIKSIETDLSASLAGKINNRVEEALEKRYISDKGTYSDYRTFLDGLGAQQAALEENFETYRARLQILDRYSDLLEVSQKYPDFQGQFARIATELEHRLKQAPDFSKPDPFSGTALDDVWRKGLVISINDMLASEDLKNVSPDDIFNFAQSVRQMQRNDLAEALAAVVPEGQGPKPLEALRLGLKSGRSFGAERDESFAALMDMVKTLDEESPAIVIAEAWNAAESQRRYSDMISALGEYLDRSKTAQAKVPSFAQVIMAELYMRRGYEGDSDIAQAHLDKARQIFALENPHNQWTLRGIEKFVNLSSMLEQHKAAFSEN